MSSFQGTFHGTFYYHRDHQGSIVALTDSTGAVVESFTYDNHYGTITNHTITKETNNPYAYTGRELNDTDLYYYRARYYDPTTQRFLSEDPIGFASGDFNFYRYVYNSPTYFTDSTGESAVALTLPIAGSMAATDGPFSLGDALGLGLLGGALVYDQWNNPGNNVCYSKGGNQNQGDTRLADKSNNEINAGAHNKSFDSKTRRRYQKEQKARKQRNKQKRNK